MNIAVLASHGGSNLQALINASEGGRLPAKIVVVISNNRDALALKRARSHEISSAVINGSTHPDDDERDAEIEKALTDNAVDLVVLAGFMKKLGPKVLERYRNRILNIHPALLPKYGGKGMYGMRVHEAVIQSGDAESGATVHLVDENYDSGEIVIRRSLCVDPVDTAESLSRRILGLEHELIVDAANLMVGRLNTQLVERDEGGRSSSAAAPLSTPSRHVRQ